MQLIAHGNSSARSSSVDNGHIMCHHQADANSVTTVSKEVVLPSCLCNTLAQSNCQFPWGRQRAGRMPTHGGSSALTCAHLCNNVHICAGMCTYQVKCDDDEVMCGGDLPQQRQQNATRSQRFSIICWWHQWGLYICVSVGGWRTKVIWSYVGGEDINKLSPLYLAN